MLETLVSSTIRRALLEYILTHPQGRFYLRGLAKELHLTISPLRRELVRLERLGMLRAYQEANIRFYVIDQTHSLFLQLQQAAKPTGTFGSSETARTQTTQSPEPLIASTVLSHPSLERLRRAGRRRVSWPIMAGAAALGVGVLVVSAIVTYLTVTNQQLLSLTTQAVSTSPTRQVTVVESGSGTSVDLPASAQAGMRSARLRLMPGAIGGFGPGVSEESY